MTRFVVNSRHDRYYAVSRIVEISEGKKYDNSLGYYHEAKLRDNGTVILDSHAVDGLTNPVVGVVPAGPGYNVIHVGTCMDGEPFIFRVPIIAWQIRADGEMRPLTVRGERDGDLDAPSVEMPNGEIFYAPDGDAIFDNEKAFVERVAEVEAEIAARRAAARAAKAQPEERG